MLRRCLLALLLLPALALAEGISVGGVAIDIPAPPGFVAVTPEMPELHRLLQQFVAETNEELAAFIPAELAPAARAGEIPAAPRRFSVQVAKLVRDRAVTASDFAELKATVRTHIESIHAEVEKQVPGLIEEVNAGLEEQFQVGALLSGLQMLPFPIHAESERTLAQSVLVHYDMNPELVEGGESSGAATTVFAHVRGRVLALHAFGEQGDLEWTRQAAGDWAAAILAANPLEAADRFRESTFGAAMTRIDWSRAGIMGLVGALAGLLISLVSRVGRRAKRQG